MKYVPKQLVTPLVVVIIVQCVGTAHSESATVRSQWTIQEEISVERNSSSLDLSGDHLISGGGKRHTPVYVRTNGDWMLDQNLTPWDDPSTSSLHFGYSVAISDHVAVVTNPWEDSERGSAYIFRHSGDTWEPWQKLEPPNLPNDAWFGHSVSLDDDYMVIGSRKAGAYVYKLSGDTWMEQVNLTSSEPSDWFGASVAVEDNRIVVGAMLENGQSGAAYVFESSGENWVLQDRLAPPNMPQFSIFGADVAISGDTIAVAGSGGPEGKAYVFHYDGAAWQEQARFPALNSGGLDSVDVDGDLLVVGSPNTHHIDGVGGKAYIYRWDGSEWASEETFFGRSNTAYRLGWAIATDGGTVVVSAPDNGDGRLQIYVPEPSTLTLLTMGAVGLLAYGLRRRK